MRLLYNMTKWLDHVTEHPMRRKLIDNSDGTYDLQRAEGKIIQQGTARSAKNYNNLESGVLGNAIYELVLQQQILQVQRQADENKGEFGTVKVTSTRTFPFPSASITVPLKERRSTLNYTVTIEDITAVNGFVENVEIYDKQLNGFKVRYSGSAKEADIRYRITGGRY